MGLFQDCGVIWRGEAADEATAAAAGEAVAADCAAAGEGAAVEAASAEAAAASEVARSTAAAVPATAGDAAPVKASANAAEADGVATGSKATTKPLELRCFVVGPISTNCYALVSGKRAMVVDPGAEGARVAAALAADGVCVELVAATHGHADHVGGVAALVEATGARYAIASEDDDLARHARRAHALGIEYDADAPAPNLELVDGGEVGVGEARFRVIAVPGHTPGGVALLGQGAASELCFVGDTLFAGSAGRTDLPGGDTGELMRSLARLAAEVPAQTNVLPGHGQPTTMAVELATNPYLSSRYNPNMG